MLVVCATVLLLGSSPLTRGKPLAYTEADEDRGLIPAHAGKTEIPGFSLLSHGAHPRSRGENLASMRPAFTAAGSSPLTRGKLGLHAEPFLTTGLIPAHAGKTRG